VIRTYTICSIYQIYHVGGQTVEC